MVRTMVWQYSRVTNQKREVLLVLANYKQRDRTQRAVVSKANFNKNVTCVY